MRILMPDYIFDNVYNITSEFYQKIGIHGIVLDIDDTLVEHNMLELPDRAYEYIRNLQKAGISICLFSNNNKKRVLDTAYKLSLSCVYSAGKPRKKGYRRAMEILKLPKERICAVGDQILTDVWGANRMGIVSVLVSPVRRSEHNLFFKVKRGIERRVLRGGAKIGDYRDKKGERR